MELSFRKILKQANIQTELANLYNCTWKQLDCSLRNRLCDKGSC